MKATVVEIKAEKLSNGILNVNGKYYFSTFEETDKYGEDRYVFQRFDIERYLNDFENNTLEEQKEYIAAFKLTVIEDSTYQVKTVTIS